MPASAPVDPFTPIVIDGLRALDCLSRTTLQRYVASIERIEEHAVEVEPAPVQDHRNRLRQIRTALLAEPGLEVPENARMGLEGEIKDYAAKANNFLSAKEKDSQQILAALAEAADSLTKRSDIHASQFRGLARELETASQLNSLTVICRRLGDGVTRLKSTVDLMRQEDQAAVAQMEQRFVAFQQRLGEAETLASTDPLTGLANRREAEKLLANRIQTGMPVCIMLFNLDGFKGVNDRFGHYVGGQLPRAFASRLGEQFRTDDVVCRWGGDEFLAVLSTVLSEPSARADAVAGKMRGLYAIQSPAGPLNVQVAASPAYPGGSGEVLFARADSILYQNKRALTAR